MAVSAIRELRPIHVFEMMERLGWNGAAVLRRGQLSLTQQRSTAAKFAHTMKTAVTGSIMRRHSYVLLRIFVQTQTFYLNCTSIKSDPRLQRPPSPLRSVEIFQRTAAFNCRVRLAGRSTACRERVLSV